MGDITKYLDEVQTHKADLAQRITKALSDPAKHYPTEMAYSMGLLIAEEELWLLAKRDTSAAVSQINNWLMRSVPRPWLTDQCKRDAAAGVARTMMAEGMLSPDDLAYLVGGVGSIGHFTEQTEGQS